MSELTFEQEILRRKSFAIISHPDAGKTTLTEKLLLYGGAIRLAGSVKSRKANKHASSDWMEIEKQRGISVTSSVLQFDYDGHRVNILDTPGHQDFSEDTYRTLLAADSAVMLIDVAKGVEEQTRKLFKVCRDRGIPVFTFVNKLDRAGKEPFALMEELEEVLGIRSYPMNWPAGIPGSYRGVYNRAKKQIELFETSGRHGSSILPSKAGGVNDEAFKEELGADIHGQLCEDIELLDVAGEAFDWEKVQAGQLTPLFFGSAMTNFGVEPFLQAFLEMAPSPGSRKTVQGEVLPTEEKFSAFVFKIQANMNPAHRDRLAFIRICSGVFEKGMDVKHRQTGKTLRLAQPQQFLAQERSIVEEAYPGDIIGLFDSGSFGIGDTLAESGLDATFTDFPVFPPEFFARVQPKNSLKRKQFIKGMEELAQEGAVQVFSNPMFSGEGFVIGAVGTLQFDVFKHRIENEYGVEILMDSLSHSLARWLPRGVKPGDLKGLDKGMVVQDRWQDPVVLFESNWALRWASEQNPDTEFLLTPAPRQAED
jgi:peptide chain release factor 3